MSEVPLYVEKTAVPHGGVRPFHQKSTCLKRFTLGSYVVQIWSCTPQNGEATKLSNTTEWMEKTAVLASASKNRCANEFSDTWIRVQVKQLYTDRKQIHKTPGCAAHWIVNAISGAMTSPLESSLTIEQWGWLVL